MKLSQAQAIVASLALLTGSISHAEHGNQSSMSNASGQDAETVTIASNYLDANWALFSRSGASQPIREEDRNRIANDYFDANWKVIAGAHSVPENSDTETATDYFDANWALFQSK